MKTFFQSVLKHIDRLDAAKLREQYRLVTEEVKFFEMVFNAMTEGVILYDLEGEIAYRNPAAEEIGEIEVPLGKASKNEIAITYPEERILEIQTIPFERGTLAMIRDVSAERQRTAEELEKGATRSICDLAAGVAHEIGNPLNAISMNLQLLERDPTDLESIEICKSQVKRLDGIIRGFLGALKPVKPNLQPGYVADPLKNCLAALRGQFEDRRIAVTLNIPSAAPAVALDKDKIEQVFFNILKNALEAMSDGGSIDIDMGFDDRDVTVDFRDSGFGITQKELQHLFEPYRTTKEHGTGLGLMISSRIIRDHGGSIAASSAVGEGTTFTVKLPRLERRVRVLK
jgi:signal transduction histidine kinase